MRVLSILMFESKINLINTVWYSFSFFFFCTYNLHKNVKNNPSIFVFKVEPKIYAEAEYVTDDL